MYRLRCLVLSVLLFSLFACQTDDNSHLKKYTVYSAPALCIHMHMFLCANYQYDEKVVNIGGIVFDEFEWQWGTQYEITVEEKEIINPPADGSSIQRTLVSIDLQVDDPIGTQYQFAVDRVPNIPKPQKSDMDGYYNLLGVSVLCDDLVCGAEDFQYDNVLFELVEQEGDRVIQVSSGEDPSSSLP